MKNYNKILEAINRGILLALDDFDDEESIIKNIKSKQVLNRDYTKEYLDLLWDEVVDLGLPSETLWCKYDLGVNPNQLSTPEDWYGDYYAWGEIEAKPNYNSYNYKFGKEYDKLTKYCNDPKRGFYGFIDNLTELQPADDAAYLTKKLHDFKFHIPTKKLCEELINYTNNYWVNNYDPDKIIHNPKNDKGIRGLNGRVFEGKNGNLLFIPAAGYCNGSDIDSIGSDYFLWSSTLYLECPTYAYFLSFDSDDIDIYNNYRYAGYNIRPVINL